MEPRQTLDEPGGLVESDTRPNLRVNDSYAHHIFWALPPHIRQAGCQKEGLCSKEEWVYFLKYGEKMHIKSYEQLLMQYEEYRLSKILLLYIPPILVVLGSVGNILSFVILRRKAMLKFSTYYYLAVLAIADTLVLFVGLLRLWVGELTGVDIKDKFDWLCKVTNVLGYTVSDFSVWLIIAVTVERYIVVCHPLKANSMCNIKRARKVILFLLFLLLAINCHFFRTVEVRYYRHNKESIPKCDGGRNYEYLIGNVWPWMDACLYSFLPFVFIMLLNGMIIHQVVHARRHRCALQSWTAYEQRRPSHEGSTRLTLMLLTISFAFLLTTLPMNICNIASSFWNKSSADLHQFSKYVLARTLTELMMYVNHSMNFFLYCAMGQKFRHQLVWMMCYAKRSIPWSRNSEHSHNSLQTKCESYKSNKQKRKSENSDVLTNLRNEMCLLPFPAGAKVPRRPAQGMSGIFVPTLKHEFCIGCNHCKCSLPPTKITVM